MNQNRNIYIDTTSQMKINNCIINVDSNDKLKEIDIKNRTCYYFDDIIEIEHFNLHDILIDKKSYKNILVINISYRTLIDVKLLCIRYDKID